eukprot:CAMPEP_0116898054 /NCGR_PEP_ID=MMETSP0467-20121206/6851_1 /TAXON_ID=283647 /ORGANISM="Mesodinium pulex, Strain SPMC105" /LENGTH=51 /DNA_ID=CAMNT_0004569947 /DNA_START=46 /DNA_END=201 /DNA_ORIENTATION=+
MTVSPVTQNGINSNLYSVEKKELQIPRGPLSETEYQMLPLQLKEEMAYLNV